MQCVVYICVIVCAVLPTDLSSTSFPPFPLSHFLMPSIPLLFLASSLQVPLSVPSNPSTPSHPYTTSTGTTGALAAVQSSVDELSLNDSIAADPSPPPTLPGTLTPAPVTVVRTPGPSSEQTPPPPASSLPPQPLTITTTSGYQPNPAAAYRMTNAQLSSAPTMQGTQVTVAPSQYTQPGGVFQHSGLATNASLATSGIAAPFQTSMHPPPSASVGLPSTAAPPYSNMMTTQQSGATLTTHHPAIPAATAAAVPFMASPSAAFGQSPFLPAPSVSLTASGLPTLPPTISFPTVAPKISLTPTAFQTAASTTS